MTPSTRPSPRAGFTLIEVLVTLILLALLAAAVFPVVTQQVRQGGAPRLANDLSSVKSGIEAFNLNVKKLYPMDVEDLANVITTTEHHLQDATEVYTANPDVARWDGPYIDASIAPATTDAGASTVAFVSGFDASVMDKLHLYDAAQTTIADAVTATTASTADFVAIRIDGLTNTEFKKLNDLIDGTTDSASDSGYDTGKLRCPSGTNICAAATDPASPAYYLATPFRMK